MEEKQNDFSKGSVSGGILSLALPMTVGIRFTAVVSVVYSVAAWAVTMLIPELLIRIFNSEADIIAVYFGVCRSPGPNGGCPGAGKRV